MIGLSSEDSRIIEERSGALSATAILIPRNKMTTRIAKHFSVHSSIKDRWRLVKNPEDW